MKNRHESGAAETPEQIIEHISRLMAEAEAMIAGPVTEKAGGKLTDLKERLASARDRLNEAYSSARETLGDAYTQTRQTVVAGAKRTDEAIRDNPYQSLAVALGVGVLLGVVIGRKSQ
jgi:ElaB/YqjD/DUF883 family membrane-anchored ribosome-binding protein